MQKNVREYTVGGETKSLAGWAKAIGVSVGTLRGRLRRGWTLEELLAAVSSLDDRLTWRGETAPLATWFRRLGLDPKVLGRPMKDGATVKTALLLPRLKHSTHPHARQVSINGESRTIADWAKSKGVSKRALRYRLDTGWLPQFALEVK